MTKNRKKTAESIRCHLWIGYSLFIFFLMMYHPADPDLWGHLYWGKLMFQQKHLPLQNTQSYLAFGYPWINYSWLSNLIMATLFAHGGNTLLILWKICLLFGTAFFFFSYLKKASLLVALATLYSLILSLLFASHFRPQIFGFFFFGWLVITLDKNKTSFLPLLFLFWANMHPSFVGGLAYWLIYLLLNQQRWAAKIQSTKYFLTAFALTFLNPYGIKLWTRLLSTFGNLQFKQYVAEWRSPIYNPELFFLLLPPIFLFFILLLKKKKCLLASFCFLPFFLLTLSSFRFYPFYLLSLALPLSKAGKAKHEQSFSIGAEALAWSFHILIFLSLWSALPRTLYIAYTTRQMPYRVVKWMQEQNISGNLFNDWTWGEYLIFHLSPQVKIAFDGRLNTAYSPALLNTLFEAQMKGHSFAEEEKTDLVLLRTGSPAAKHWSHEFHLLYRDETAILFIRNKLPIKPHKQTVPLQTIPFP